MKEISAVEWLLDNLAYNQNLVGLKEIIEKAIKMEEQQNDDFYQLGYMTCENDIYWEYDEDYQKNTKIKIKNIISKEDFNLKMFNTTSEHAKEYGLNAKKPLYLQSFSINENKRLNGIGNAVIKYINDYAIKNKNDIIFGHIPQNADFTKDSRESFLPNIDMIKYWLKDKGYEINNDNNDFHKIVNNTETLKNKILNNTETLKK